MDTKAIWKTIKEQIDHYLNTLETDGDFYICNKYRDDPTYHSALFAYYSTAPLVWMAKYIRSQLTLMDYVEPAANDETIEHTIDEEYIFEILSQNFATGNATTLIRYYYTEHKDNADLTEYVKKGYDRQGNNIQKFKQKLRGKNDVRIYKLAQFYKDVNDTQFEALGIDNFNELDDVRDNGGKLSKCNLDMLRADNNKAIDLCLKLQVGQEILDYIEKILSEPLIAELYDWSEYEPLFHKEDVTLDETAVQHHLQIDTPTTAFERMLNVDKINDSNKKELMYRLECFFNGGEKGKRAAFMLRALLVLKYIHPPKSNKVLYSAIREHFKCEVKESGISRYWNKYLVKEYVEEFESVKGIIEKL